jgi:hypothetical protein
MDDQTADKRLVGYCGLYCGGCDVLRLYREGQAADRIPQWNELPDRLSKQLPFKPKPIICHGCSSDTVFGGCAYCGLRSCAKKKGSITICTECDRYPCFRFRLIRVAAWLFSLDNKLPHHKTKAGNLARIGLVGLDQWLAEQDAQWRCPDCQTPFSWYRSTCTRCGRDLDDGRDFLRSQANRRL